MPTLDPRLQRLADGIRSLIEASPYNAADVARLLDVDRSAVSRWMNGKRQPTVQNLVDLAALLGVEVEAIWQGPQAIPATPEQRLLVEKMATMSPEQQQALLALAAATLGMTPSKN